MSERSGETSAGVQDALRRAVRDLDNGLRIDRLWRFLLALGDAFADRISRAAFEREFESLIGAALPRLTCRLSAGDDAAPAGAGKRFSAPGRDGKCVTLWARAKDGGPLREDEAQACAAVAALSANLGASLDQVNAARNLARLKDEFLCVLSHELRTPLHAVLGYVEILERAVAPEADEFTRDSVDRLRANAMRLQDLIEEMLCYAELRAGHRTVQVEECDLRSIFEPLMFSMRHVVGARPVKLTCEVAPDVPPIYTDRRKLRRVVSALLSNACKFTERGEVSLRAAALDPEAVCITVADTGIGIDPRDVDLAFEAFRQLDGPMTRRFGGLGLGLALVREVVETLGGTVDVESRPGAGTEFRVSLPVALDAA